MEELTEFSQLPWEIPSHLKNFVPSGIRAFLQFSESVVITWHERNILVFLFKRVGPQSVADMMKILTSTPVSCQVFTTENKILDIIIIGERICMVDVKGTVLSLQPKKNKGVKQKKTYEDDTFRIISAFKLSPLKKVLAVFAPDERGEIPHFAFVHCNADNTQYTLEVYSVLWKVSGNGELKPVYSQTISGDRRKMQGEKQNCCTLLLTKTQSSALFCEAEDVQILLLGLPSGQLYCVFLSETKSQRHVKLVYQSSWPISHVLCPPDGSRIVAVLDGGLMVVLSLSPRENHVDSSGHLNLKTSMLPVSMTACCSVVGGTGTILCTNGADTWLVRNFENEELDVNMLPIKGVIAVTGLEGMALCLTATSFKVFYALNLSKLCRKNHGTQPHFWSGGDLNTPLQYLQEMKWQTQLLAQLRKKLDHEHELIAGICAAARAKLLPDNFTIVVKMYEAEQILVMQEDINLSNSKNQYRLGIEIHNNSDENFAPPLWEVSITISYQSGERVSKHNALNEKFSSKCPFTTDIPVSFSGKNFRLPVHVRAHLVAQLVESCKESNTQWLSIAIGEKFVDISQFLNYSLIPPHSSKKEILSLEGHIKQISHRYRSADTQVSYEDKNPTRLNSSLTVSVSEQLRSGEVILNKILINSQHQCDPMLWKEICARPSEVQSIWMSAFGQTVQLSLNQSCGSVMLQSANVELLHSVKSWLTTVLHTSDNVDISQDGVLQRCQSLKAVLESERLNKDISCNALISIYQDIRNNISAFLPP